MSRKGDTRGACASASTSLKSFSAFKFDLMDAIGADPGVGSVNAHIAWFVIQRMDQRTGTATVTDEYLQSKVHKNRAAYTKFRKRMVEIGWFDCILGRSGRATVYIPKRERLTQLQNIALDQRILDQEREHDSAENTTHYFKLRSAENNMHYSNVQKRQRTEPQRLQNIADSAKNPKRLHLKTPTFGLPLESEEFTCARETCPEGSSYSEWTEQDWRARYNEIAAFLEHDQGLLRAEAEACAQQQVAKEQEAAKRGSSCIATGKPARGFRRAQGAF